MEAGGARGAQPRAAVSGVEREAVSWSCAWSGHAVLERELWPPRALQRPRTGEGPESLAPSCSGVMGRQGRERHRCLCLRLAEDLHSVRCEHPVWAAGPLRVLGASPVQGPLHVPESGLSSSSAPSAVTCLSALKEDRRQGAGTGLGAGCRAISVEAQGQKQPVPQPRGLHPTGPGAAGRAGIREGVPWACRGPALASPGVATVIRSPVPSRSSANGL